MQASRASYSGRKPLAVYKAWAKARAGCRLPRGCSREAAPNGSSTTPASKDVSKKVNNAGPAGVVLARASSTVAALRAEPALLAVSLVYLVQGLSDMAWLAEKYFLKDELGASPAQVSLFLSLSSIPWMVKPLLGFVSDSLPLLGYRRRSYLLLASVGAAGSWLYLAAAAADLPCTLWAMVVGSGAVALSDVVVDSMVVERAREEDQDSAGNLQSMCWAAYAVGQVATAALSGALVEQHGPRFVFALTAAFPLLIGAASLLVHEERVSTEQALWMTASMDGGWSSDEEEWTYGAGGGGNVEAEVAPVVSRPPVAGPTPSLPWEGLTSRSASSTTSAFALASTSSSSSPPDMPLTAQEAIVSASPVTEASSGTTPILNPIRSTPIGLQMGPGEAAAATPAAAAPLLASPPPALTTAAALLPGSPCIGGVAAGSTAASAPGPTPAALHTGPVSPRGRHRRPGGTRATPPATASASCLAPPYRPTLAERTAALTAAASAARSSMQSHGSLLWSALSAPAIAWPVTFLMLLSATPAADDAVFYFEVEELGFTPSFLGSVQLAIAVASLAGVWLYNSAFKSVPLRSFLLWGNLLGAALQCSDLLLVARVNTLVGLDDRLFVLGGSVVTSVITNVLSMPTLVLAARLCPKGLEATMFATLMSLLNLADGVRYAGGAALMNGLGVGAGAYENLPLLVGLCNVALLLPLPVLALVPNDLDCDLAARQAAGRPGGGAESSDTEVECDVSGLEVEAGEEVPLSATTAVPATAASVAVAASGAAAAAAGLMAAGGSEAAGAGGGIAACGTAYFQPVSSHLLPQPHLHPHHHFIDQYQHQTWADQQQQARPQRQLRTPSYDGCAASVGSSSLLLLLRQKELAGEGTGQLPDGGGGGKGVHRQRRGHGMVAGGGGEARPDEAGAEADGSDGGGGSEEPQERGVACGQPLLAAALWRTGAGTGVDARDGLSQAGLLVVASLDRVSLTPPASLTDTPLSRTSSRGGGGGGYRNGMAERHHDGVSHHGVIVRLEAASVAAAAAQGGGPFTAAAADAEPGGAEGEEAAGAMGCPPALPDGHHSPGPTAALQLLGGSSPLPRPAQLRRRVVRGLSRGLPGGEGDVPKHAN